MKGVRNVTDEMIASLIKSKNSEGLEELSVKHKKRCVSLASRICGRENGEEVFYEALNVLFQNGDSITSENLLPYLLKTVRNLSLKKREYLLAKKRGGNETTISLEEELFPSGEKVVCDTPENLTEAKEIAEYINRFLKTLSKDTRMIFVCRCYFGMTVSQTAKHLKIGESKVKTSLSRTRKELKNHLERNGLL